MKNFNLTRALAIVGIGLASMTACTDLCKDVNCNDGACVEGDCVCNTGYEGTNCETEQRAKFVGNYTLDENCPSGPVTGWGASISNSGSGVTKVTITGFGGFECPDEITVIGTVNGTDVTIDSGQSFCAGTLSITSGSGTMNASGTVLTVTYTYSIGGQSETCTGTYTKL